MLLLRLRQNRCGGQDACEVDLEPDTKHTLRVLRLSQLLGSWKPNVPYGPDGRMAAGCLPDGVFPLLFPDGAPTATHLDFQSIWPKSQEIWTKSARITKSQHIEIWRCQFLFWFRMVTSNAASGYVAKIKSKSVEKQPKSHQITC